MLIQVRDQGRRCNETNFWLHFELFYSWNGSCVHEITFFGSPRKSFYGMLELRMILIT